MKKSLAFLAGFVPFLSFAHPGHGETEGFTIIHYIIEPAHAISVLLAVGVLYWLFRSLRRKEKKA